jgi:hypothetical protein
MNVVDSSGWLEYFADGPNADFFAPAIEDISDLVVPSLSIYEVFKRVLQQRGEAHALQAVGVMAHGLVVELSMGIAINAAKISVFTSLAFTRGSPRRHQPAAIAVDKLRTLGVGWPSQFKRCESGGEPRGDPVAREDGAKPSLPRNCERHEICEHH